MKKIFSCLLIAGFVVSCGNKETSTPAETPIEVSEPVAKETPTADNSKTSVDWAGTYEGTLPCADCEGIKTIITLNQDDTFVINSEYIGKNNKSEDKGNISWTDDGNKISFTSKDGQTTLFQVAENKLIQLDQEGNKITGSMADLYVLAKK